MIRLEDIVAAYKELRKKNRRSADQVEFELHWEQNCVELYEEIVNHSLSPTAYTFVVTDPKPREIFASDLKTRILHYYINSRLRPLLEKRMTTHSYNNRIGMGQGACINAVASNIYEKSEGFTKDAYIIHLDLKGCFPNINLDIAFKQIEKVLVEDYKGEDKDELHYILSVCIFSYPTMHCEERSSPSKRMLIAPEKSLKTKPLGIGAPIGHLLFQIAVNYYFDEIDKWLEDLGVRHERYVDDIFWVGDKNLLLLIPELRERLGLLGAKLNESKHYCRHWSKGVNCLGVHIKADRIYPNKRIIRRAKKKAKEFNKCIRPSKVITLISSLNSYLGICKNSNGYARAWEIVNSLNPKWFKYIKFNTRRVCLQPNLGYREKDLLLNSKSYDTGRKRQKNSNYLRENA